VPKKLRFTDEINGRFGVIEYSGGNVLQRRRRSGGNWNLRVTFAYLIY